MKRSVNLAWGIFKGVTLKWGKPRACEDTASESTCQSLPTTVHPSISQWKEKTKWQKLSNDFYTHTHTQQNYKTVLSIDWSLLKDSVQASFSWIVEGGLERPLVPALLQDIFWGSRIWVPLGELRSGMEAPQKENLLSMSFVFFLNILIKFMTLSIDILFGRRNKN